MKKLIFASFVLLFAVVFSTSAQSTLQFGQVKLIDTNLATVPAGTVWKLEGVFPTSSALGTEFQVYSQLKIEVNGTVIEVGQTGQDHWNKNSHGPGSVADFPLWVPAGTTLKSAAGVAYISVIEFNVIP